MALIKCTNCGHMISDKAVKCPKCGTPIQMIKEAAKPIEKEEKVIAEVESLKDDNPISDSSSLETNVHNEVFLEPQSSKKGKIVLLCSIVVIAAIIGVYFLWNGKVMAAYEKQDKPIYSEELVKYAESGDAVAMYSLGKCFYNGDGVSQDYGEAIKWWKKAAEKGHETAMYNLGVFYANGAGVSQDYGEAVKWYKKAAEKGHEDAKEALREMGY